MKTFELSAFVTISIYTEVRAETLEEAIKISQDREIEKSLWGQDEMKKEYWLADDYDGSPENIHES